MANAVTVFVLIVTYSIPLYMMDFPILRPMHALYVTGHPQ